MVIPLNYRLNGAGFHETAIRSYKRTTGAEASVSQALGLSAKKNATQCQAVSSAAEPALKPPPRPWSPTWVSSVLLPLNSRCRSEETCFGPQGFTTREQTGGGSCSCVGPEGYSGGHLGVAVPLGAVRV